MVVSQFDSTPFRITSSMWPEIIKEIEKAEQVASSKKDGADHGVGGEEEKDAGGEKVEKRLKMVNLMGKQQRKEVKMLMNHQREKVTLLANQQRKKEMRLLVNQHSKERFLKHQKRNPKKTVKNKNS
uniref:Uncharacterized protein n=1 Tax=Helianthus annuus TaxID=4232 RepID=A0A251V0X5_HELAN